MGKKSTPQAPAAPDPVATARAQTDMNKESAVAQANLNRIDQYTPQGNITYSQVGTNDDGTPRYRQDVAYSPDEQRKYEQANQVATSLNDLAINNVSRVQDVQSKPFSFDGIPDRISNIGSGIGLNSGPNGPYATQNSVNGYGDVQGSLEYKDNPLLPNSDALNMAGNRAFDAVYDQYKSRLDPEWQQREDATRSRLAAQGISEDSDAYRTAMDNLGRDRNDAYSSALNYGTQAGSAEQSRLYDLALRTRAQGTGEINTQGQFANTAQDQKYQQALGVADLFNAGNSQSFNQELAASGFNNQARAQDFNEAGANATLANQGREGSITEQSYLRNLPLNEIATLLGTGGGVNDPNFAPAASVGVAAPDYQGLVSNNYNAAMNQYNQQMAARSSMLGNIFGTLGSVGGAVAMSDMRLKRNIRYIGELANGVSTYVFRYLNDARLQFGVMAQQVLQKVPDAVGVNPDGYMYVDYRKVYA